MKKVTTITPCHNSTKYLRKCWESLKNQTIGMENMEVIFVDDASDDDGATWEMLLSFEKEAPESVMVIQLDENMRQGGARNVGLSYATGEYIQFLDSDDSLRLEALDELYQMAKEKQTDILQYDFFQPNGKSENDPYCRENIDFELLTPLARKGMLSSEKISFVHAPKFYRREFLAETGVRFAEHVVYEEPLFVYPLLYFANKISVITNQYYIYQVNETSTMETAAYERLNDHMVVQKLLHDFMRAHEDVYVAYKKEIDAYFYRTYAIETVINCARGAKFTDEMVGELTKTVKESEYDFSSEKLYAKDFDYFHDALERVSSGFSSTEEFLSFAKRLNSLCIGEAIYVDIVLAVASRGGLESVLNNLCLNLKKQKYNVRVIQILDTGTGWLDESVEFYGLTTSDQVTYLSEMKEHYKTFVRKNGVADIILTTGWPLMTQYVSEALNELGFCAFVCSYLHGAIDHYAKDGVGGIECLQNAKAHFCINHTNAKRLLHTYPGAPVFEIGNPVSKENTCFSKERDLYSLVYIGRFSEEKNPKLILRALRQLPEEFHLKLVGDGEQREELKNLCEELEIINRVEFMGWLDRPWEYLKEDGFLIVSSRFEGFSLVAAEALLSGMPVISTPVNGIIDYVKPGENGYLYEQDRPDQLAEILIKVSEGILPYPNSETCFLSAERFLSENVYEKINAALWKMYLL